MLMGSIRESLLVAHFINVQQDVAFAILCAASSILRDSSKRCTSIKQCNLYIQMDPDISSKLCPG
jgi:hypothetical protein